ncbi:MAG: hypothetical protein M1826_004895 [Phylliscum demangeonii]|nr:MAG: hypothetical protein M1826_004895 [Phylliscum demangeonii]
MVRFFKVIGMAVWGAVWVASVVADTSAKCGSGQKCPDNLPCCSQYGQCGVGAYCLGGCDPLHSNSLQSCVPAPVCKSGDYKLNSLDSIMPNTKYLGDASKTNWVSSGQPVAYQDQVLLTMAPDTVGTLLASTTYLWYGKVSATMKTSRGRGVVTAFILLSDVKDEIDYEFVGGGLETAESNYYFQGITNYQNEANITLSDTFNNYHTYTIDWTPDQITWSIDGQVGRTKKRSDTWNATSNRYEYPQTPARVQLSLWPGGLPSNGEGTINWAGGLVDWNGPDIQHNGYYYASVKEVTVQCYDPPSNAVKQGSTSYIYSKDGGMQDTVQITDKPTVLKSLLGSGTNMSADYPAPAAAPSPSAAAKGGSSGTTAVASAPAQTPTEVATVPGLTGAGPGTDGQRGASSGQTPSDTPSTSNNNPSAGSSSSSSPSSGTGSGAGSDAGGSSPAANPPAPAPSSSSGGFSQGPSSPGSSAKGSSASGLSAGRVVLGSLVAGSVAVVGAFVL